MSYVIGQINQLSVPAPNERSDTRTLPTSVVNDVIATIERQAAEIARLTAEVERLQSERRWIPVEERLPDAGVHVMATYRNELGKVRRVRAFYAPKFAIQYEGDTEGDLDPDYYEENDEFYWPEGWYEAIDNWDDFCAVAINSVVTGWMPLPPTQAQGE